MFRTIFTPMRCCQIEKPSCQRSLEPQASKQFFTSSPQTPTGQCSELWAVCSLLNRPPGRLMGWAYYAQTIPTSFDSWHLEFIIIPIGQIMPVNHIKQSFGSIWISLCELTAGLGNVSTIPGMNWSVIVLAQFDKSVWSLSWWWVIFANFDTSSRPMWEWWIVVGWAPMGRRGLWVGSAAAAADEPWNSTQILLQTPGSDATTVVYMTRHQILLQTPGSACPS